MPSGIGQRTQNVDVSRFSMVPRQDVPRSVFRTQATHKTTLNSQVLIPVFVEEVLPGDSFRVRANGFARMSTPIAPLMDNIWLDWFWFYVPYRLVWPNFVKFMGERQELGATVDYLVPQVVSPVGGFPIGGLFDYMGLPTIGQVEAASTVSVSALPLRAYNRIWVDWFRDENLAGFISGGYGEGGDGPDSFTLYVPRARGKRHDYFTACLPWPAKPIAPLDATVAGQGADLSPVPYFSRLDLGVPVGGFGVASAVTAGVATNQVVYPTGHGTFSTTYAAAHDVNTLAAGDELFVRLNAAGYPEIRVLIEGIRQALAFQHLMELDARGGTRYTEIIRAHFGVVSPDQRLQRPEYLGGGSQPVQINPVAQTSQTSAGNALGDLAATGTSFGGSGFSQSFTEHGVVLGIVNIRADVTYQQGCRRFWFRQTKYDFYWPALANLGEQAVLSREIYCTGEAGDIGAFGYQERWAEYKHVPSMITGRFRSTALGTLDLWHAAERFVTRPTLNETFIQQQAVPFRVFADGANANATHQEFLLDCLFDIQMVRPIPAFNVPGVQRF